MSAPALVRAYGAIAGLIAPFAAPGIRAKMRAQGVDPKRYSERMGYASAPRPEGRLLWLHAASVGESLSVLRLVTEMGRALPDLAFLLTSGTATSAQIVAHRLPPRSRHQFAPLDTRAAVSRFLAHWRPDAAIFVESELWPNMLRLTADAGIPMALLNARISDRSARAWNRAPQTARHLMGLFAMIHCQDARTTRHLHALGLGHARTGRNLKAAAGPLPVDAGELAAMRAAVGDRPVWVASSTHAGEEEVMLDAHARVRRHHPHALLILVPRHPERAESVARLIDAAGLDHTRRSTEGTPDGAVYLADTLGETGLWYALAPITCLAGSFTPVGGHNPFEPAAAGSVVLHGPLYANFADTYTAFDAAGGATEVADATDLGDTVTALMDDPARLASQRDAARAFAAAQEDMLDEVIAELTAALSLAPEQAPCRS